MYTTTLEFMIYWNGWAWRIKKRTPDYGNAQVAAQQAFGQELENALYQADEQTAVVFFDEFSVCEKPSGYYGWAEKNSRPTFTTNEKKEREQMDF